MATNSDQVEGTFDEYAGKAQGGVGEAFGDAKTQAEGKIRELRGKAQDAYGKARETIGQKVDEWSEDERVQRAREAAARGAERVRETVQEQPVAVLAGGIALGFLIGWLASGSSRRSY